MNTPLSAEWTRTQFFWQKPGGAAIAVLFLFLLVQSISSITPPFQSADEFNHLKRAYLLAKGEIFLGAENGWTGGHIDSGLLQYMKYFDPIHSHRNLKVVNPSYEQTGAITWTGRREFSVLPNTAGYFPLPYAPQAMALAIGENTNMSVRATYYLARAASLIATLALLWLALRLYPIPAPVVAVLIFPMTLYQFGSTSLDAVATATCVLMASLFMRGADKERPFTASMHWALAVCIFMLATSRSLIALTLLPLVLYSIRRSRSFLISTSVLIVLSAGWLVFVFKTARGMTGGEGVALAATKHYLADPGDFAHVLINTFANPEILYKYWTEFLGVFGALDAPLNSFAYRCLTALLFVLAVISVERDKDVILSKANLAITAIALITAVLLVLIILVVATPLSFKILIGFQGRYLIPVAILLGFSLFNRQLPPVSHRIAVVLIFLAVTTSITSIAPALLLRYWVSDAHPPAPPAISFPQAAPSTP